jgi:hypothetical protein
MSAQANVKLRYEHLKGEFIAKNENESLATLVEDAIGAGDSHRLGRQGKTQLRSRYGTNLFRRCQRVRAYPSQLLLSHPRETSAGWPTVCSR